MRQLAALPPLSLYVHVPWCLKKCPYCDFNSHALKRDFDEKSYVRALFADLESALPQVWGRRIYSIFFGGGTPSLLSAEAVAGLVAHVRALLPLDPYAEITLEANPGTFERAKFAEFKSAGINRLSVGIQSFDGRFLRALGRVHDEKEAFSAAEIAAQIFEDFNLDLMYALPNQGLQDAIADIERAISFAPSHLSAYQLTIEPNTLFFKHPPEVPDDDLAAGMQLEIEGRLAAAGFEHYETSAFAKKKCRHNLNYWQFGDYLGIGAGAHGKLSFPEEVLREMRWKNPEEYQTRALSGSPVQSRQRVAEADLPFEFMMNALRLDAGFPLSLFEERTGLSLAEIESSLTEAEDKGFIQRDHLAVVPTMKGKRFLNELLQIFLP